MDKITRDFDLSYLSLSQSSCLTISYGSSKDESTELKLYNLQDSIPQLNLSYINLCLKIRVFCDSMAWYGNNELYVAGVWKTTGKTFSPGKFKRKLRLIKRNSSRKLKLVKENSTRALKMVKETSSRTLDKLKNYVIPDYNDLYPSTGLYSVRMITTRRSIIN